MGAWIEPNEALMSALAVKAVLAILASVLFVYYKVNWDKARRHFPVHFFYAKWRAVRYATALGVASFGFAAGFAVELFGGQLGFSPSTAQMISSAFEIVSLLAILLVFFELCMDDVPHFQRLQHAPKQEIPKKMRKRGKRR
ncbi:MAG: hypothetical protein N3G80_02655 [Candidatus Micrarchaeota archaeon]|nr:hypothetical protein [Candidatus Micrarchaeota archaeon]